jgi:hypothetical protein
LPGVTNTLGLNYFNGTQIELMKMVVQ